MADFADAIRAASVRPSLIVFTPIPVAVPPQEAEELVEGVLALRGSRSLAMRLRALLRRGAQRRAVRHAEILDALQTLRVRRQAQAERQSLS